MWNFLFSFKGRTTRLHYNVVGLVYAVLMLISYYLLYTNTALLIQIVFGSLLVITLVSSASLSVRRWHDIGFNGLMYFICFTPIIGNLISIHLSFRRSQQCTNAYGECPAKIKHSLLITLEKKEIFLFKFSGRIARHTYCMISILYFIIFALVTFILLVYPTLPLILLLWLITTTYIFISSMSFNIRRFHDLGLSGWYSLIMIIPLIGNIFSVILMIIKGQPMENKYGESLNSNNTGI